MLINDRRPAHIPSQPQPLELLAHIGARGEYGVKVIRGQLADPVLERLVAGQVTVLRIPVPIVRRAPGTPADTPSQGLLCQMGELTAR